MAANINGVSVPNSPLGDDKGTPEVPVAWETPLIDGNINIIVAAF